MSETVFLQGSPVSRRAFCGILCQQVYRRIEHMRFLIPVFFILFSLAPFANAACILPLKPLNLADGAVADVDDMNVSKRRVERYMEDSQRYLKCLDTMDKTAIGTGRDNDERRRKRITNYNTAHKNMSEVLSVYDASVAEFNQR